MFVFRLSYILILTNIQACGNNVGTEYGLTDWSLCGYLLCEENNYDTVFPNLKEEICQKTCTNLNQVQVDNLRCFEDRDTGSGEVEVDDCKPGNCKSLSEQMICNNVCDVWNCWDESQCNGFFYGDWCSVFSISAHKVVNVIYIPPYEICDGTRNCMLSPLEVRADVWWTKDEVEECYDFDRKTLSCIGGELYRRTSVKRRVRIFNTTRCTAIVSSNLASYGRYYNRKEVIKTGTPYCVDYIDQTNCTDEAKVAVQCVIKGYGLSTISKTMVCGRFRKGFCTNGMDVACIQVTPACVIHKHQLCDKVPDCGSGADENHPSCRDQTRQECYRNYRTNRKLPIPGAWLMDGVEDCLNGVDENWNIECGSGITRRYEVADCQDVFVCRYGALKFKALIELCNGMDECGSENFICEKGMGLSSETTAVYTNGNTKILKYCLKGLEDLKEKLSGCVSREFSPFNENVYGKSSKTIVTHPEEETDCNFLFGEGYVFLSCLGKCPNSNCPLTKRVDSQDCPAQYPDRIYTVVDNRHLTFVTRRHSDYHNDYFVCGNGVCTDYDKVCNLWDDCGDGSDEAACTNSFKCHDGQGIIPLDKKCDGNPECNDMSDECNTECGMEIINGSSLKAAAWTFGVLATLLNIAVLYENVRILRQCKSTESLINRLLLMLIGLGDLLVGLYLVFVAIADSTLTGIYCKRRYTWLTSSYCNFMGVISTFGTQVSLFSLAILSFIRAVGVYRNRIQLQGENNNTISRKNQVKVAAFILLIMISAVAIAVISLFPVFEDFFLNGLVYDQSIRMFHGQIGKAKHFNVIQSYYGRSKNRILKWALIENLVRSMFSSDYGNLDRKIARVDFYGNDGVCLFKYFVTRDDPQRLFTIPVLIINIICFVIVSVSYLYINISTIKSSSFLTKGDGPTADMVNKRNLKLQRKVATIIITDFLCWVPFVLV